MEIFHLVREGFCIFRWKQQRERQQRSAKIQFPDNFVDLLSTHCCCCCCCWWFLYFVTLLEREIMNTDDDDDEGGGGGECNLRQRGEKKLIGVQQNDSFSLLAGCSNRNEMRRRWIRSITEARGGRRRMAQLYELNLHYNCAVSCCCCCCCME
jgi:hypothetical protein